jgi:hypothetical protein
LPPKKRQPAKGKKAKAATPKKPKMAKNGWTQKEWQAVFGGNEFYDSKKRKYDRAWSSQANISIPRVGPNAKKKKK